VYEARLVGTGLNRNTDNTVGYLTLKGEANFRVQDRRLRFLIFSATFLMIFYSRWDRYGASEFLFFWQAKLRGGYADEKILAKFFFLISAGGGNRTPDLGIMRPSLCH
jgi:hypothetical protein